MTDVIKHFQKSRHDLNDQACTIFHVLLVDLSFSRRTVQMDGSQQQW